MEGNDKIEDSTDEVNQSDDGDSDDSEEREPKLKFGRMSNDLKEIFSNNAVTCIAVHPKFVVLGNNWGIINLLDHQGNFVLGKQRSLHSLAVNQISIDSSGDYIATCSDDGRVIISGLNSTENNDTLRKENTKIRSVAIDPNYNKTGSGRRFITGDDHLILYEQTFLSRRKSTVLANAEGTVNNIKWKGQFVAWADNLGLRVYDISAHCSLGLLKWPCNSEALPENYRCNICWKDTSTLLIGWVDCIRICIIRKRTPQELAKGRDLPELTVEIVSDFKTDCYVSGIGPLDDLLVVLGYERDPGEEKASQRPVIYVIQPQAESYVELCFNPLSLRGFQTWKCDDYHLDSLIEDSIFFIASPKDVVVANPYDTDDRIRWLMDHGKYKDAMAAVANIEGMKPCRYTLLQVGQSYINHLLNVGEFEQAAQECEKILGTDKRLWEEEVFKFARIHQLRAVSPYLPRDSNRLDRAIYEMVLFEFLKMDAKGFLDVLKKWSPDLYDVDAIKRALFDHFLSETSDDKAVLMEALAILYSHELKYDKALAMYLKLGHKDVFELIRKHKLYKLNHLMHVMIEALVKLDADQAFGLFLEKEKIDENDQTGDYFVDPDVVITKLASEPYYQYLYLNDLDRKDTKTAGRKYHGLLVQLYAKYSREKLLPLLKRSDHYPIQEALNICQELSYYEEMVYLLARMGRLKDALSLITKELKDIEKALDFCKEHNDIELWADLIDFSLSKPEFITFLLQRIGTYVDPRFLVQRIDNGKPIPGLKNSLVKMMRDYSLQVSVQVGCKKILTSDYFNLLDRLVSMQQRGVLVDDDQVCGKCAHKVIVKDFSRASNVVIFFCKHTFHSECLASAESCIICNSQKPSILH